MRIGTCVRVLAGDALVHLEEVAVALLDDVAGRAARWRRRSRGTRRSSAARRRGRRRPRLGGARRDVAGHEVAERRVAALEEVVALGSGIWSGERVSSGFFGTQMRPSLRSDSDISVSFDWKSSLAGMHVGWICV